VLSVVLRILHLVHIHYSPIEDMSSYLAQSELFFGHDDNPDLLVMTTRYPVGYPIFLGLVRSLFGWDLFRPALWIQVFAEGLTTWCVILCGRFLYGAQAGLLAGLAYALYQIAILRSAQLMTESLAACFMFAALAAFFWHQARPSVWRAILTGLLFALACHFRVVLAPLAVIMAGYALWILRHRSGTEWRRTMFSLAAAATVFAMLMVPVTIRNSRILGRFVLYNSANAEVVMVSNNPVSRGEQIPFTSLPSDWQKEFSEAPPVEKPAVASRLARQFLYETHTAYFLSNVLPYRFREALWRPQWMYAGQGEGGESANPFGPYIRIPVISSIWLTVAGFLGMLCRARRFPGFAFLSWAALFAPTLLLPIDPRYRYLAEVGLVLPAGALAARGLFARDFVRRLRGVIKGLTIVSGIWTLGAVAWMGGPNLYPGIPPALSESNQSTNRLIYEKPVGTEKQTAELVLGQLLLNPAVMNPVVVSLDYRLTRPDVYKPQYRSWVDRWPSIQVQATYFDDSGTTVGLAYIPHKPVSQYQDKGGSLWRVLSPPGTARSMKLILLVGNSGTIELWNLAVRGPIWVSRSDSETNGDQE
jgi:hypothetical protein